MGDSLTLIRIENRDQIPADWGTVRAARRKSTVTVREPTKKETFEKTWGTLTAVPGKDFIIVEESGEEYPIKKGIFDKTYVAVNHGRFRKKAISRLIQVPEGVIAELETLEGRVTVGHPDWWSLAAMAKSI